MTTEFEFVVVAPEAGADERWAVVGFDGMAKVTFSATSEWHARNIANALNNGTNAFSVEKLTRRED